MIIPTYFYISNRQVICKLLPLRMSFFWLQRNYGLLKNLPSLTCIYSAIRVDIYCSQFDAMFLLVCLFYKYKRKCHMSLMCIHLAADLEEFQQCILNNMDNALLSAANGIAATVTFVCGFRNIYLVLINYR